MTFEQMMKQMEEGTYDFYPDIDMKSGTDLIRKRVNRIVGGMRRSFNDVKKIVKQETGLDLYSAKTIKEVKQILRTLDTL